MVAKAARRTFAEQIATEMVSATEEDDVDRLEVALRESRYARLSEVQAVEQVNAQQRLTTLHKIACVQALESGDVEALESAMMAIHRSQVSYYIHRASWFEAAEKSLRLLKRQSSQQMIKSTGNETPSQKHVDEVRRFHRPSQHVHTVMTATLTLLGESTHALKEWKNIQSLLRVRGANSVLQRIKNYKRSHSQREDVKKAETLLSICTLQAVTSTGPGIAAFYHWVRSVLDQTSEPDDKQDGQIGDQTDAQAAGQADAQTGDQAAGQADAQTGQADAQTGQANAQTAGQANAQKASQTDAQKAGQANAQTSGQAKAQTAGQTDAHKGDQTAGQADAQTGDQTDAETDAQTDAQTAAQTDDLAGDQTDVLATAVGTERSNVTRDYDEKGSGSSMSAEGPDGKSLKVSENRNGEPASATAEG